MNKKNKDSGFLLNFILALLLGGMAAEPASAGGGSWIANSGDWFTGSNWSSGAVPTAGDDALIFNGGTAIIGASGARASGVFIGNTDVGHIIINGALDTWDANTLLVVGDGSTPAVNTLDISNASQVTTRRGIIGLNGSGSATVDGTGTAWTNTGQMYIGGQNTGTLTISGGAVVNNTAAPVTLGYLSGVAGTLNIGAGGSAGILNAPSVTTGSGSGTLNFNHNDSAYYFTSDGTSGGTPVQITGSTVVRQIGTGTTILNGANSYTGGTQINAGTLSISADNNLGNAAGGLSFDGGTLQTTASFATGRTATLNAGGGTFDTGTGTTLTYLGHITGTGSVTKTGAGILIFANNTSNYTGGTTLDNGTLSVSQDSDLGDAAGSLTFNGGTLQATASFSTGRAATLNAGGGTFDSSAAKLLTYNGVISGTGGLTKIGSGGLVLTNTNTYTGGTMISAGSLQIGVGTSGSITGDIVNNGTLSFGGVATLSRTDTTVFAGNITGTGTLSHESGGTLILTGNDTAFAALLHLNSVLQIGNNGTTGSFNGDIYGDLGTDVIFSRSDTYTYSGGIHSGAAVTQAGSGTTILAGANNYGGGTSFNAGTLSVSADGNLGDAAGGLIFNGGTLQTTASFATGRPATLNAGGGTFNTDTGTSLTYNGVISGTGGLTKQGGGTLTLSGTNTYSGGTAINGGTLSISADSNLGDATGGLSLDGGTLQFTNGVTIGRAITLKAGGGTFKYYNSLTGSTISGAITGPGGLTQAGPGNLVLTGTNTYSGGTTISSGAQLQIGDSIVSGSITGDVVNNGQLTFFTLSPQTFAGNISGTGALYALGYGTLILTGNDTATGGTNIALYNSALQIGNNGTTGSVSGDISVQTGSNKLIFNRSDTYAYSGVIDGAGAVTQAGSGTTILTGANTYSGGTTVSAGTLQGTTTSLQGDITDNAALVFDQTGSGTYAGAISGTGSLTKQNAGTLILTGTNTLTGTTTVSAGTLRVNGSLAGPATINAGATLGGTGSIGGNVTIADNAILAPGNSPGTLTVGSLTLNSASILDYQLAAPTGTAGVDSDLVNVTGNLTLDGVLNVTDLGGFDFGTAAGDTGSYRLLNYGGTLTDNGLDFGTGLLAGYNYSIDTATAGQVNLSVDYTGLQFWDGPQTAANNAVDGGSATWDGSTTNWTNQGGNVNLPWGNLTAVFGGSAGTVEVDGTQVISGLQFMTGGYMLQDSNSNGALQLAAGGADLRSNAGVSATVDVRLTGTGALTKTGAGTIVLTGANTYSGGTTISDGTLQGNTASLQGNITDNAALVFDQATDGTYAGVISGTGSLTKQNTGTLILTGANTYSGGTAINGGTLSISADSNLGDTAGGLSLDGGTLQFTNGVNIIRAITLKAGGGTFNISSITLPAISGAITGPGGLTLTGTGNLLLLGTNDYTGGTTITAGTVLQIGSSVASVATGSITGDVVNNGQLVFDNRSPQTFAGNISGTGTLGELGLGILTLTGNDTATGGAFIIGNGALQIGDNGTTGSVSGDISVSTGSKLIFNRSDTYTYNGVISGDGTVTQAGSGTTILTGTNTYTGGTAINAGTLSISADANLGDAAGGLGFDGGILSMSAALSSGRAITLNAGGGTVNTSGNAVTLSGIIGGTGAFTKQGAGTLTLTGANTYSGGTTVSGGTLSVNGSIANSAVTVNSGGTLGGNGTVGTVTLAGGTVGPGNSIGTLHVSGDVDFSGGGVYRVEADAAGNSDQLIATGTASLGGGSVQVIPASGNYGFNTDYTILTANSINGTFDSVSSTLAFLTPTLSYDANNVYLSLTRNNVSFNSFAVTPNQQALARLLTRLSTTTGSGINGILNQFLLLTNSGVRQALNSLSGEQYTHSNALVLRLHDLLRHILFNRLGLNPGTAVAYNPQAGPLLAYQGSDWPALVASYPAGAELHPPTQRGAWLEGFGGFGKADDTVNAAGAQYDNKGVAFGVDTRWQDLVVGLAGSYSNNDADTFGGKLNVDSYQLAAYGGWKHDDYYARADTGFGYHDTTGNRTVAIGATRLMAAADYHMYSISADIEAGRHFSIRPDTELIPYIGLDFNHIYRPGYTETGAGAANLNVRSNKEDSLRARLGLRLSHTVTLKNGYQFAPYAYGGYVHELLDDAAILRAGFSALPTDTFSITGVNADRSRAEVGAGISGKLNQYTSFNIAYDGNIAGSDANHSFSAVVRYEW